MDTKQFLMVLFLAAAIIASLAYGAGHRAGYDAAMSETEEWIIAYNLEKYSLCKEVKDNGKI